MAAIGPLLIVHDIPGIVDLVKKLQTDFNYIFPRRATGNVSFQSTEVKLTNIPLIG
jgi:hypothetical protein